MNEEVRGFEEDGGFARDAFAVTVAATTPRLGFGAEDLVLGGRARVRRRRWSTAAGGVAVVAAVGVGLGTGAAGFGGASPKPSEAVSQTPAQQAAADSKLGYQGMVKVLKDLDGSGTHITLEEPLTPVSFVHSSMCNGATGAFGYIVAGNWTADGKPAGATTPHVTVMIQFGNRKNHQSSPVEGVNGWGPTTTVTLPDHSVLATTVNGSSDGQSASALRTLPDGRSLLIFVLDAANPLFHEPRPDKQVTPFPFTKQQLAQAAGDMSLTFPFANGYEPAQECPGPSGR
jgi:hypothetical protein